MVGVHDVCNWAAYFQTLFQGNDLNRQYEDVHFHAKLFPQPSEECLAGAEVLNMDISVAEVYGALKLAASGKAPGIDGIPMEFYKYATIDTDDSTENVLADHITHLFNRVLQEDYLAGGKVSALVPVPKPKGDASNQDDYRGIAVGSALSKLYSMVLLKRLDTWAERNGIRAKGQAGFRSKRGTADNAFVLNHIIEKYQANKKPVYAAFIDFRKAYDSIDRNLLLSCLESYGLQGNFLNSIKNILNDVTLSVRIGNDISLPFSSKLGVKQGDPLSPLLFGLFIDRIEKCMADMIPTCGVQLGNNLLQVLLYADDLVLLAESPFDLQKMLDTLQKFCLHNALTVNNRKSEVVIFNSIFCVGDVNVKFFYDGREVVTSTEFIYLGMIFDSNGVKNCIHRNIKKVDSARFALIRRCYQLDIHNVALKCYLFDTLVKPVINFGCEVWGPGQLHLGDSLLGGIRGQVESTHIAFLRSSLGVRRNTGTAIIMKELQREPLALAWIKQILNFYSRVQRRTDNDIVKLALKESYDMALRGVKTCWVAQLSKCIKRDAGIDILRDPILNTTIIMGKIQDSIRANYNKHITEFLISPNDGSTSVVRSVPDNTAGMKGFKFLTYLKWFENSDKKNLLSGIIYIDSNKFRLSHNIGWVYIGLILSKGDFAPHALLGVQEFVNVVIYKIGKMNCMSLCAQCSILLERVSQTFLQNSPAGTTCFKRGYL